MGSKVRGQRKPFKQYVQHSLCMPVLAIHTPAKAAFLPTFCQPTAIQDRALPPQSTAPLAYSLDPRLPKGKQPLSDATRICSLQPGSSKKGLRFWSSTILTTPARDKMKDLPIQRSDRLARVGTTYPKKLSFVTEQLFPWDKSAKNRGQGALHSGTCSPPNTALSTQGRELRGQDYRCLPLSPHPPPQSPALHSA